MRCRWQMQHGERVAAVKFSSGSRKAAQKIWVTATGATSQNRPVRPVLASGSVVLFYLAHDGDVQLVQLLLLHGGGGESRALPVADAARRTSGRGQIFKRQPQGSAENLGNRNRRDLPKQARSACFGKWISRPFLPRPRWRCAARPAASAPPSRGREPCAAGGRCSTANEWPRSNFQAAAARQRRKFG